MNSIASQPINLLTENPLNEINRMIVARVLYEFNSSQHATNALVFGFWHAWGASRNRSRPGGSSWRCMRRWSLMQKLWPQRWWLGRVSGSCLLRFFYRLHWHRRGQRWRGQRRRSGNRCRSRSPSWILRFLNLGTLASCLLALCFPAKFCQK